MDAEQISLIAGSISTLIFAGSNVPMILKAVATRDMRSYSLTNLILANVGNGVHWFYIAMLPFGPIWLLHTFYTVTAAILLVIYLKNRYRWADKTDLPLTLHTGVHRLATLTGTYPSVKIT